MQNYEWVPKFQNFSVQVNGNEGQQPCQTQNETQYGVEKESEFQNIHFFPGFALRLSQTHSDRICRLAADANFSVSEANPIKINLS